MLYSIVVFIDVSICLLSVRIIGNQELFSLFRLFGLIPLHHHYNEQHQRCDERPHEHIPSDVPLNVAAVAVVIGVALHALGMVGERAIIQRASHF